MRNRPPARLIPLGADKWLNAMPTGTGWTPPVVQPVKEVEFKRCKSGEQVVEWLYAEIRRGDLGTGSVTNTTVRDWVKKKVGRATDDAGHIIGKNQGGLGTVQWNIFPQTGNINRGVFASDVERVINNAAMTNTVKIWFRFEFETRAEPCRPSNFHYFVDLGNGSTINNDLTNA